MELQNHARMGCKPLLKNIEIIDIAEGGAGVGKSDSLVVFVQKAVPGDSVDVLVQKKKKNYAQGVIHTLNKASLYRAEPFCAHFFVCGGCKWQHISYNAQLLLKQKGVCDVLERIGGINTSICEEILGASENRYYRNKLEFTFSPHAWLADLAQMNQKKVPALGFHIPGRFDKILQIDECFLQPDPSNKIRNALHAFALKQNYSFYDVRTHLGELRGLIIRTSSLNELMVAVHFGHVTDERVEQFMSFVREAFPEITSLLYLINQKKNDTIYDQNVHLYHGRDHIFEEMKLYDKTCSLKYKIGLKSFYQTNSKQAQALYQIITEFADFKGNELVYDLYTGAGTIANFIAHRVQKVIGIDYVQSAIEDAILNSCTNKINNTLFYSNDMKDILNRQFVYQHGKPDIIITDPPRAGMHPDVVKCLLDMEAPKIVYVSCNPATQARDLTVLKEKYHVSRIKPVDMFPHTHHVENVVLLCLKSL